jgi:hypothetical protein
LFYACILGVCSFALLPCLRIKELYVVDIGFYDFFVLVLHLVSVQAVSSVRPSACNVYTLFDFAKAVLQSSILFKRSECINDSLRTALSTLKPFKVITEHKKYMRIGALPICN